jgi:hypothetical protein
MPSISTFSPDSNYIVGPTASQFSAGRTRV